MSFDKLRKELEAKVRSAKAASDEERARREAIQRKHLGAAAESVAPGGVPLPPSLGDRRADPALRVEALGAFLSSAATEGEKVRVLLRHLSDSEAPTALRLACLEALQAMTFSSRTASEWRKDFVEALRSASESSDAGLRRAAFELLTNFGDRASQDVLLEGLERPEKARVEPAHALRLLAESPHTRVAAVAREIVDRPRKEVGEEARLEALRVLASDPTFRDRFAKMLADPGEDRQARMLAATALSSLDVGLLRATAETLQKARAVSESVDDPLRRHVEGLLKGR